MPCASAPRVSLSFGGSILAAPTMSCWNTVLISTMTCSALQHLAGVQRLADGSAGGTNSTNLAPNTVDDVMSTSDVGGIEFQPRRDPSPSAERPGRPAAIRSSRPCPPGRRASCTLASGFITRPARVRHHGHRHGVGEAAAEHGPRDECERRCASDARAPVGEARRGARLSCRLVITAVSSLSRQVEVAVAAVDGQRDQQRHRHHDDQRGAHRVADRDADTGRPAGGEIAVVGVDQQDRRAPSGWPAGTTTAGRSGSGTSSK